MDLPPAVTTHSDRCTIEKRNSPDSKPHPPYYGFQMSSPVDKYSRSNDTLLSHKKPLEELPQSITLQENNSTTKIPSICNLNNKVYSPTIKNIQHHILPESLPNENYRTNPTYSKHDSQKHSDFSYSDTTSLPSKEQNGPQSFSYSSFYSAPKYFPQGRVSNPISYSQTEEEVRQSFPEDLLPRKIPDKQFDQGPCNVLNYHDNLNLKQNFSTRDNKNFESLNPSSSGITPPTPQKEKNEEQCSTLTRFPVSSILSNIKQKSYSESNWKLNAEKNTSDEDSTDQEGKNSEDNKERENKSCKDEDIAIEEGIFRTYINLCSCLQFRFSFFSSERFIQKLELTYVSLY